MLSSQVAPGGAPVPRAVFGGGVGLLLWIALAVPSERAWAHLVINEFLPDPEGSDAGKEFVELLNTGPEAESLAGVSLQFGNGAAGPEWTNRWTGVGPIILQPDQRFLLVDRNWMGEPAGDVEVYLGIQNGPDAPRLVRGETVLDLVGYGPLTDQAMMEGEPADIAPGLAVARRPDGHDSNVNGQDFVLAVPTPGEQNFQPFHLEVAGWNLNPPSVDRPGMPVQFYLRIRNGGTETFPVGPLILRTAAGDQPSLLDLLPPGHERGFSWNLVPVGRGLMPLSVLVPLPTPTDTLVLRPASLQVGSGAVVLNEVLAVPRRGQGEWVEIVAAGPGGVDLTGFGFRDEDGDTRNLPEEYLEPGEFLVLAQDSLALADWHLENQSQGAATVCPADQAIARQRQLAGWPSLNNTIPADRNFADRIYLIDPGGDVIDHVTWGGVHPVIGGDSGAGVSLERAAIDPRNPGISNWAACTSLTGSTPGCSNSVSLKADIPVELAVHPRILDPGAGHSTVHFLFTLTAPESGWDLRVFDLWGVVVRDLGGDSRGAGPRDLLWDGRDDGGRAAPPGGYIVLLETRNSTGVRLGRAKALLVVR